MREEKSPYKFDATFVFQIKNFVKPVAIPVQQTLPVLTLTFHPNRSNLHFSTFLFLHTNVSLFKIPLLVYNGHLKVSELTILPPQNFLELCILELSITMFLKIKFHKILGNNN